MRGDEGVVRRRPLHRELHERISAGPRLSERVRVQGVLSAGQSGAGAAAAASPSGALAAALGLGSPAGRL